MQAILKREMRVVEGTVPAELPDATVLGGGVFRMAGDDFLFETPGHIRFHYRLGHGLTVQVPAPGMDSELQLYLMGTVFGAVAWFNGFLPIHASAIVNGSGVTAFTGDSGAGKSTLAAAMAEAGFAHVCDDTLVLDPRDSGVLAYPDGKPLKLWDDAFDLAQASRTDAIETMPGKFFARVNNVCHEVLPLTDLVFLEYGEGFSLEPITGADKFTRLPEAFYRPEIHRERGGKPDHLRFMTSMASHVRFWKATRPRGKQHLAQAIGMFAQPE